MGVFSGAGAVVVLAVLVVLVGLVTVIGLAVGLHRRDIRRRTFSADAWAAAGYGIPQAAVDRALAASDLVDPYPAETTVSAPSEPQRATGAAAAKTATKTTTRKTASRKTAAKKTAAKKATASSRRR